jgi:GNAT acetyltransferase-like protein
VRDLSHGPFRVRRTLGNAAQTLFDGRWDELVARQGVPSPTLTAPWLRELVRREPGTPLAVAVEAGNRIVAAGAFAVHRPLGRRGVRIGTWLAHAFSSLAPDMLVDPEFPEAGDLVLASVLEVSHVLHLGPSPAGGQFANSMNRVAPWGHVQHQEPGWTVALPAPRAGRMRKNVRYVLRRAERLGVRVSIEVRVSPDEVDAALPRLFALYEDRWRSRSGTSPWLDTEEQRAWHRRAIGQMAEVGSVRVVEVFENGYLVATVLGLLAGRGAGFHTTATRLGGRLESPGHVALLTWTDIARDEGAETMVLGRGAANPEGPKRRLGSVEVPFANFLVARSEPLQRLLERALRVRRSLSGRRRG